MLLAFHKPYGVLSQFTNDGSQNRTLAEFHFPKNVYPLGRLDADSEGLLLLSDEPGLNQRLLHPRQAHEREYWVQVERVPTCWISLELVEGKNRQVRRMTAALGHPTLRLIRVRIGKLRSGDLAEGK